MRHIPLQPIPAVLLALLPLLSGCEMETRVVSSTWDQWRQLAWADQPAATGAGSNRAGGNLSRHGYAIELERFRGPDAHAQTFALVNTMRQEAGLANLWYTSADDETVVYAGRFRERDSAEAKTTLERVRRASIDGERPFASAKVIALSGADTGEVLDPNDLRTLTGSGKYALQVGYFDARYGENFRRAAETAAEVLREQGEEAYYYHGPNRSMVLVGAWTYGETFSRQGVVDRYSNLIRDVQERYPHNIPNGRSFDASFDPEYVKSQASFVVPIP